MRTDGLTVFEYMEDFDNQELNHPEWADQLLNAVLQYNKEYDANYDPEKTLTEYCHNKQNKYFNEL